LNLGYLERNSSRKRLQFACPIFIPLIGSSSRCCLKYSRVRTSDHECPRRTTSDQEWPRVVLTTNETMVLGETAFHYLFIMTNELFSKTVTVVFSYFSAMCFLLILFIPIVPNPIPLPHHGVKNCPDSAQASYYSGGEGGGATKFWCESSPGSLLFFLARYSLEKSLINCLRCFYNLLQILKLDGKNAE